MTRFQTRSLTRNFLLLAVLVAGLCTAASAQASIPEDSQPVQQVVLNFVAAWNRHDVPAMAALHTANVNFTNISGQWWRSREEVAAGLQHVHSTVFAKSTMTLEIKEVRFLSENVAVVHGVMELHNVPPAAQGECVFMRILIKQDGAWLIDDFQNTLISAPIATPAASTPPASSLPRPE